MKLLFLLGLISFASFVLCDCDQLDGTKWDCSGGSGTTYPIQNFSFDDDDFTLYLRYSDCTVFQEGNYEENDNSISVEFGVLDECENTEENSACDCYEDFDMQISNDCLTITGPNGETCVPQGDCAMQMCPNGQTPTQDPNYEPSTNECGPSSIPVGAPSFAFAECCNQHDLCYPICGKDKRTCDYEFYSCMACACEDEYDTSLGEEVCLILACLYFQAVDEFGCGPYENSQDNGCICTNNKAIEAPRQYKEVGDKFGGVNVHEVLDLYVKGTLSLSDFVCDAPLDPDCPNNDEDDSNNTNNNSNNSNNNNDDDSSSGSVLAISVVLMGIVAALI